MTNESKELILNDFDNNIYIKNDFDNFLELREKKENSIMYTKEQKKELLIEFVKLNKRLPIGKEDYKLCHIGPFYQKLKFEIYEDNELYNYFSDYPLIIEGFDNYLEEKGIRDENITYTFDQKINLLIEYVNKNEKIPGYRTIYKDCNIGGFYYRYRKKIDSTEHEVYQKFINNIYIKNDFDDYLKTLNN